MYHVNKVRHCVASGNNNLSRINGRGEHSYRERESIQKSGQSSVNKTHGKVDSYK